MTAAGARRRFHRLGVARVDRLCDDAAAVTFDVPPDLAVDFAFRPGQFLTVRRVVDGQDQRRSYSISSPVGAPPRIGVRQLPGGVVSSWLVHGVRPGDDVQVQPPSGSFTPDLQHPGNHVLIAAGSGITPVLSIAASVLANDESQVSLIYGNRRSDKVMFVDEVADLKNAYPTRFQLFHVLSREAQEVELLSGRLDAAKLRRLLPIACVRTEVDHWWLCGPHGMVIDIVDVLRAHGVPDARLREPYP